MASDGDLLGRRPGDPRREWWLEMLAYGSLPPEAAASVGETPVRDVMSKPPIAIDPTMSAPEIARTLRAHNVKRLPVVDDGEIVGIVTRTDLLGVVDDLRKFSRATGEAAAGLLKFIGSLAGSEDLLIGRRPHATSAAHSAAPTPATPVSAEQFREAVRAYKQEAVDRDAEARREADLARKRQVDAVMHAHVSTGLWRKLIDQADVAAKHGEKEFLLLRFPSDLCSDGGRMVDVAEPGWEQTLARRSGGDSCALARRPQAQGIRPQRKNRQLRRRHFGRHRPFSHLGRVKDRGELAPTEPSPACRKGAWPSRPPDAPIP